MFDSFRWEKQLATLKRKIVWTAVVRKKQKLLLVTNSKSKLEEALVCYFIEAVASDSSLKHYFISFMGILLSFLHCGLSITSPSQLDSIPLIICWCEIRRQILQANATTGDSIWWDAVCKMTELPAIGLNVRANTWHLCAFREKIPPETSLFIEVFLYLALKVFHFWGYDPLLSPY